MATFLLQWHTGRRGGGRKNRGTNFAPNVHFGYYLLFECSFRCCCFVALVSLWCCFFPFWWSLLLFLLIFQLSQYVVVITRKKSRCSRLVWNRVCVFFVCFILQSLSVLFCRYISVRLRFARGRIMVCWMRLAASAGWPINRDIIKIFRMWTIVRHAVDWFVEFARLHNRWPSKMTSCCIAFVSNWYVSSTTYFGCVFERTTGHTAIICWQICLMMIWLLWTVARAPNSSEFNLFLHKHTTKIDKQQKQKKYG